MVNFILEAIKFFLHAFILKSVPTGSVCGDFDKHTNSCHRWESQHRVYVRARERENMEEQKKILCVGLVCLDIINVVDKYPEEDTDSR